MSAKFQVSPSPKEAWGEFWNVYDEAKNLYGTAWAADFMPKSGASAWAVKKCTKELRRAICQRRGVGFVESDMWRKLHART